MNIIQSIYSFLHAIYNAFIASKKIPFFHGFLAKAVCVVILFSITPIIITQAGPATTVPEIVITKNFDGTAPFDATSGNGNDTGDTNDIVRAGDVTSYTIDLNLNDPAAAVPTAYDDYTVTFDPLPLGFRWESLPLACIGAGSEITGEGITNPSTLTCNLGTKFTGDAFAISVNIFTLPTVINNSTFSLNANVSVGGTTNTANASTTTITATTLPKIDLQKTGATFRATKTVDGVVGGVWTYGFGIKMKPGSEAPAMPITFTDDISGIHPDAKYIACTYNDHNHPDLPAYAYGVNVPYVSGGVHGSTSYPGALIDLADAGTIDCTPQAGNEQVVDITVDNIPAVVDEYPTTTWPYVAPVTPGDKWIGAYAIGVWIPYSAFTEANNFSHPGTNQLNDFNPVGLISGQPNYNDFTLEPGRGVDNVFTASQTGLTGTENWYTQVFQRPTPGYFDKLDYKFRSSTMDNRTYYGDVTNGSTWNGFIGSAYRSGDGVMASNGSYTSLNVTRFTGVIDIPAGYTQCVTIDTNSTTIAELDGYPGRGAYIYGGRQPSLVNDYGAPMIQYGVGGLNGIGASWASFDDQRLGTTCRDEDSTGGIWYDSLDDVPGGAEAVTKVRSVLQDTFTVEEQIEILDLTNTNVVYNYLGIRLTVKPGAIPGTISPNYGSHYDPSGVWFNGTNNGYSVPSYNATTGTGVYGDRITVVGTRVRVNKTVNDSTTESQTSLTGTENTWYLKPTSDSLGVVPAGTSDNVVLIDTLPAGFNYVIGSTQCADDGDIEPNSCEPTYTINLDGTSTLQWDYGTFTAGSSMATISFDTTSDLTLTDGESFVNSAVISADNDNSLEEWRTDTATVVVVNTASFSVQKKVLTPVVPIGDPITYQLIAKNSGSNPVATTDFIDWVSFNGDQRVPQTNYNGTTEFTSLDFVSGVAASNILYTSFDRTNLLLPDDLDPDTINPAIQWCTLAQFSTPGCPTSNADVTGFRIQTGTLNSGEDFVYNLTITPRADDINQNGDVYTNRFKGRVAGLSVGIESNNVPAYVYAGSIGDTVFYDRNGNGIQDTGEEGLDNITVTLTNTDGSPVDCDYSQSGIQPCVTTTDTNGNYLFEELFFGDYTVTITKPADFYYSGDNDEINDGTTNLNVSIDNPSTRVNLDGDFGLTKPAEIGNYVWEDRDADGVQNLIDINLENAEVRLLDSAGQPVVDIDGNSVSSVLTNFEGEYSFTNLRPGDYIVEFITPTDYYPTLYNEGGDTALDSDAAIVDGRSSVVSILAEENNDTIDAGFFRPAQFGDFAWEDLNANGLQDIGEPGIGGITVSLTDTNGDPVLDADGVEVLPVITDPNGLYQFTNLIPGQYIPTFSIPNGYLPTIQVGGEFEEEINSNINSLGVSNLVGLQSNDSIQSYDAGYIQAVSIGDYVWYDIDGDGIQEVGEDGIEGVTVSLVDENGDPVIDVNGNTVESVLTDINGLYQFENLYPGQYSVVFERPFGYVISPSAQGGDTSIDSNGDYAVDNRDTQASTPVFSVQSGEDPTDIDQGFYIVSAIGDYVWVDTNGNGVQDTEESALQGVIATLLDENGDPVLLDNSGQTISPLVTDENGFYEFTNIPAGSYIVEFELPSGYQPTIKDAVGDGVNSDVNQNTIRTDVIVLSYGEETDEIDLGVVEPVSVGNYIFDDENANGIQDTFDQGIPSVTVSITDANGDPITDVFGNAVNPTQTDEDGLYSFTDLYPGTYIISVDTPEGGYYQTVRDEGSDDVIDSDGSQITVTLESGDSDTSIDSGFYIPVQVGDTVWLDTNANGILDGDEAGLAGVTVQIRDTDGNQILDADGTVVGDVITNENGEYSFDSIIPGSYVVSFIAPNGMEFSPDVTQSIDSESVGETITLVLQSGTNVDTIDSALYIPATIGNYVWNDLNADGIQDTEELGISGITVSLTDTEGNPVVDASGNVVTNTTTDENGLYEFTNLTPGDYIIVFSRPEGYTASQIGNGTSQTDTDGQNATVTVISGQNEDSIDFGMYQTAGLGNFVWIDTNGNGLQDIDEDGLANAIITLLDENGDPVGFDNSGNPIEMYTTDESGFYEFTNLTPGSYSVSIELPEEYVFTTTLVGEDTAVDSNIANGVSDTIMLGSGEYNDSVDAGAYIPATIGNYVWLDTNGNGLQDEGEEGMDGIDVFLVNTNTNETYITTTDENGLYQFTDLIPGDYDIEFVKPSELFIETLELQGEDTSLDSSQGEITLVSDMDDDTLDFAFVQLAEIGNFVFEDLNGNGVQEFGDPGIAGVTVTLTNTNTNEVFTTITDENGAYRFTDVFPAQYTLEFSYPEGEWYDTLDEQESVGIIDSNPRVSTISVSSGEINETYDHGFIRPASLGNFVWIDTNGNGLQDEGEEGFEGVSISLIDQAGESVVDANGNPVESVLTDENGFYEFTNLLPGEYQIVVETQEGYSFTINNLSDLDQNSDVNNEGVHTYVSVLLSNENDDRVDAGLFIPATISGLAWLDLDNDGQRDENENVISDATVTLVDENGNLVLDVNGNPVLPTEVNDDGTYEFGNLIPDTYRVIITPPAGLIPTEQNIGSEDSDSDIDSISFTTSAVTVLSGSRSSNNDGGLYPEYTVSIEDPYVCGSGFFGIVAAALDPVVSIQLYRTSDNQLVHTYTPTLNEDGTYEFDLDYENESASNYVIQDQYRAVFTVTDRNGNTDSDEIIADITIECNDLDLIRSGQLGISIQRIVMYTIFLILVSMSYKALYIGE